MHENTKDFNYQRVIAMIHAQIDTGEWPPGHAIPSERQLCARLSVSRTTIRRAIEELVRERILVRVPAKGTYVAERLRGQQKKTGNIAFIRCVRRPVRSSIERDVFYPSILTGLETTLAEASYNCLVQTLDETNPNQFMAPLAQLIDKVDGIVCAELRNREFLRALEKTGLPLVLVSPSVVESRVDVVSIDNINGAIQAINHLVELGHTAIGYIGGNPESIPSTERHLGYLQGLSMQKLSTRDEWQVSCGWRVEDGYQAMSTLINGTNRPTAVFAASDLLAKGCYEAIVDQGLQVPELSVVGFDDIELAKELTPPLTTVAVPRVEMGQAAARLILERLQERRDHPLKVLVPTQLITRDSVGKIVKQKSVEVSGREW